MRKIRAYCSFGYAGATYEEEFEIEDNVSDAEIDNEVGEESEEE